MQSPLQGPLQSPLQSPLLDVPGAVAADPPDEGVAAHYGDPVHEQRALAGGEGFVDRSNRGVVRVSGPDRLSWLHNLTTQHLSDLQPGDSTETLVLNPQGRIQHHLQLVDDGESVWAHVEPGAAPAAVEFLESMRFMLQVEPVNLTGDYTLVSVFGEHGGDVLPEAAVARRTTYGADLFVPRDRLVSLADRLREAGEALAGLWAFDALRIADYRPRLGIDTEERTIPHELPWLETAVHLDKGCYRGQETVAKVYNTGMPPRRLVFLHLDGSVDKLPARGDPVEHDGKQVGFVGSAARHHDLGPIALALVRYKTPVEARLLAGGVAAAQEPTTEIQDKPRVSRRL